MTRDGIVKVPEVHDSKSKDLLDSLTREELVKFFIAVGRRVAREGNPYKRGTPNHTAFQALFPAGVHEMDAEPYFKQLDTNEFESWSVEEVRAWLHQY